MYKWKALQAARPLNPQLDLEQLGAPVLRQQDNTTVRITNSCGQHKLFWGCQGCEGGWQHVRVCTSKSIKSEADLACRFCRVNPARQLACQQLGGICPSEVAFMQLMWGWGLDCNYCHQVVPGFWARPIDFYNYTADFYVQIDGRHHWTGMYQYSKAAIAELDLKLNLAAAAARKTLVRVSVHDMHNPASVYAALQAAMSGATIVLTPSYATYMTTWQGIELPYEEALKQCASAGGVQLGYKQGFAGVCEFRLQ